LKASVFKSSAEAAKQQCETLQETVTTAGRLMEPTMLDMLGTLENELNAEIEAHRECRNQLAYIKNGEETARLQEEINGLKVALREEIRERDIMSRELRT